MEDGEFRGIRLTELVLAGLAASDRTYGVSFREHPDSEWRPLSIIAGPSQTGKTTVIDFIRYCLDGSEHPQHPEVLASVRAAILETELAGETFTIERSATGPASRFASTWPAPIGQIDGAVEARVAAGAPSDPSGLSQFLLAACGLDNIELPVAPKKEESATNTLSMRDLMRVMFLPNDRLDSKNLLFENSNYMITQKYLQTIDVMFDVHDADGTDLAARIRLATDAARQAEHDLGALRSIAEQEYPVGPLVLETDRDTGRDQAARAARRIADIDRQIRDQETGLTQLRESLREAQEAARDATIRVRNRESLLERLAALRGQYADDKRKLSFLKEAERVFDPLQVHFCPACLSRLSKDPAVIGGSCNLCGHEVNMSDSVLSLGVATEQLNSNGESLETTGDTQATEQPNGLGILDAELKATTRRLEELNRYWSRLDSDLAMLRLQQEEESRGAQELAASLNRVVDLPAPFLAFRDDLGRQRSEALLRAQSAEAGLRLWDRVRQAEDEVDRLKGLVTRLRSERSQSKQQADRAVVVQALSARFGAILAEIGYPKLADPMLDERLVPSVRGLPYTSASSGGLVLISIAWYLAVWEVAYERNARAPGLLVIDSPQKNLGHAAHEDDPEFADSKLVENFYQHVINWLNGDGKGAQLIVVDNSPPALVANYVVVRYTRDSSAPPYGLIADAVD